MIAKFKLSLKVLLLSTNNVFKMVTMKNNTLNQWWKNVKYVASNGKLVAFFEIEDWPITNDLIKIIWKLILIRSIYVLLLKLKIRNLSQKHKIVTTDLFSYLGGYLKHHINPFLATLLCFINFVSKLLHFNSEMNIFLDYLIYDS